MTRRAVIHWQITSAFAWGIRGLHTALAWAGDPELEAFCSLPIDPANLAIDAEQRRLLTPFLDRSAGFQDGLRRFEGGYAMVGAPVLAGLGATFEPVRAAHNVRIAGSPTIGLPVFEEALAPVAVERARRYAALVTSSTWNERLLRAAGFDAVRTVHEGVDSTRFHPGARRGLFPGRFVVFSGGKAELRKGQDLVMRAFGIFAERHREATLVTAWHSPWPRLATTLDRTGVAAPVTLDNAGRLDVSAWAVANGVPVEQVIDLGTVPHGDMPSILREMDVAVFPNRGEGGTNQVAMECMASGIPVILSRNTGHLDIIEERNCFTLDDQRVASFGFPGSDGVEGWGESRVDEIVARLEEVISDRSEAARRARQGAETIQKRTWAAHARQLKEIVASVA
jgi:glycosyltransferase involved in cell wall biosynthesis